jgi:hypothetical protein
MKIVKMIDNSLVAIFSTFVKRVCGSRWMVCWKVHGCCGLGDEQNSKGASTEKQDFGYAV